MLGAGLGVAITTALAALPTAVLAFMVAQPGGISDPTLVRMLGDLNTPFFSVTSVMTAVFLVGLGLAMLGGEMATRWLGWLSVVVAVFNGLAVWIGVTFSSYHGKGWMMVGWGAVHRFSCRHVAGERISAPARGHRPGRGPFGRRLVAQLHATIPRPPSRH